MRTKFLAVASVAILALAAPVRAHHSHASYDISKWVLLEGTVKQVVLISPHSLVYLDVKGEHGDAATWALEATAPAGIFRNGVQREDVRPGDKIKARCHVLRDGGNGCLLGFVTPLHGDAARGDGVEREWD